MISKDREVETVKRFKFTMMILTAVVALSTSAADAIRWRTPVYSLVARQMPLREVFNGFAVAQGMSVVLSDAVVGNCSGDFHQIPALDFLDRLSTMHNLTWYYDGSAIYVYAAGEVSTALTDLRYMKADDVRKLLRELGVEDSRFPIKTASEGEIIMVSGPPRYVQLVLETIARADRLKQLRTFNEMETRIFPLRHSWADSVSFGISGVESGTQIRGVAELLQEIMAQGGTIGTRDAVSNRVETAESRVRDLGSSTPSPVIRPDNRLNAVVVRDVVTRMPMYERLIEELDRPQKLVEIQITTVEMTRDDALDWQLSITTAGADGKWSGGAGMNPRNFFGATDLAGQGLAGSMSYLGNHVRVSASLTALREKGKARHISRTSILTLNNMEAQMSDTQSYHARCVGKEVATLEEVSAGTRLGVKPRVVPSPDTNTPRRVWLTMELQDGGFDTIVVDAMPMTRTSTLETQASVAEGESILLAGYFRTVREEGGWGIPYLRDIPLIGWIFGGASWYDETVQRLFILTPRVIELNTEDIVRVQATRNRSIALEETLDEDFNGESEKREERERKARERDDERKDQIDDDRNEDDERAERLRKEQRDAAYGLEVNALRDDSDSRRDAWKLRFGIPPSREGAFEYD